MELAREKEAQKQFFSITFQHNGVILLGIIYMTVAQASCDEIIHNNNIISHNVKKNREREENEGKTKKNC